jgi:serine/threonine protein kinase
MTQCFAPRAVRRSVTDRDACVASTDREARVSAISCSNPTCGYVVERDDQKFCPKCGAFLPLPSTDDDPFIGRVVADGKFRIDKVLGEGGMGKVYLAEQKLGTSTRKVAIKTLQPEHANDPQIIARFHRETKTVIELEHPNTIKFFDFGDLQLDGRKFLFIAMEFIQGETLAHLITRGRIDVARAERILMQVCGSLEEAHEKGIIHRDLKPDNIYLTQKGARGDWVKVLDFGIAKRSEAADPNEAKLTKQGMVLGTPPYMSPEQFTGQELDRRSDVYALGVIAYEMLTGHLPFNAATPWEWASKHLTTAPTPIESQPGGASIPPRFRAAIMRALAKNRDERQKGVVEFLQELSGSAIGAVDWTSATNFTGAGAGAMSAGMADSGSVGSATQPLGSQGLPPPPSLPPIPGGYTPAPTIPTPVQQPGFGTPGGFAPIASQGGQGGGAFAPIPSQGGQGTGPFGTVSSGGQSGGFMGGIGPSGPGPFGTGPHGAVGGGHGFAPAPSSAGFAAVPPLSTAGAAGSNPGFPAAPPTFNAPSGFGAPTQPTQPQPRSRGLIIGAIVGVLLLLSGAGVAIGLNGGTGPEEEHSTTTGTAGTGGETPQVPTPQVPRPPGSQEQLPTPPVPTPPVPTPPVPQEQVPTQPVRTNPPDPTPPPRTEQTAGNSAQQSASDMAEGTRALSSNNFAAALRAMQSASARGDSGTVGRLRTAIRTRGRNRIDNLILENNCAAAQALFRQLRAGGVAPRADSFGDSCTAP